MLFAIIHRFKENCGEARAEARPQHIEHVKGAGERLKAAGPLPQSETSDDPWGSLIVINADSLTAARLFAENDPYVKAGIVENTSIQPWDPKLGSWVE